MQKMKAAYNTIELLQQRIAQLEQQHKCGGVIDDHHSLAAHPSPPLPPSSFLLLGDTSTI